MTPPIRGSSVPSGRVAPKPPSRVRRLLGFSAVVILGALLCRWLIPSDTTDRQELGSHFQAELGFPPPRSISTLRGRTVTVGDSWNRWLQFTLDEAIESQLAGRGFTKTHSDALSGHWGQALAQSQAIRNPNAPVWWRTPGTRRVRIYYRNGHARDFAGFTVLWMDDETRTVFAQSSAWH